VRTLANLTLASTAYTTPATIEQPETVRLNIQLTGAAVFYQLGDQLYGPPRWLPESFLLPGRYSFDVAVNGVRFRAATATAAQITVDAKTPRDIGAA
jgi:hypothetical protein